jgi:hypothetical protein
MKLQVSASIVRTLAVALGTVALSLATLLASPAAARQVGPDGGAEGGPAQSGLTGDLPRAGGLGLAVWQGGRPEDVPGLAAQLGCRVESLWVVRNGQWAGFVFGAPEAVNTPFRVALNGGSMPPGPVLLRCGADAEAIPAVQAAADATLDALRTRDQLRLRDMMSTQLRERLREQDFQQIGTCVPSGAQLQVQSREVSMNGDRAQVQLSIRVTPPAGATYAVERRWEFQWQPDTSQWRLSSPPACPYASDAASVPAVQAAADAVFAAFRDRDQTRLRDLAGDQLRTQLRDEDFTELGNCVPAGAQIQIQSRDVVANADQAQVRLRVQITPSSGVAYTIDRMWEFQQRTTVQWRLSESPVCPWAPPA